MNDSSLRTWFYANAENQPTGPVSFTELKELAAEGAITAETPVIQEGETEWRAFGIASLPTLPKPRSIPNLPPVPTNNEQGFSMSVPIVEPTESIHPHFEKQLRHSTIVKLISKWWIEKLNNTGRFLLSLALFTLIIGTYFVFQETSHRLPSYKVIGKADDEISVALLVFKGPSPSKRTIEELAKQIAKAEYKDCKATVFFYLPGWDKQGPFATVNVSSDSKCKIFMDTDELKEKSAIHTTTPTEEKPTMVTHEERLTQPFSVGEYRYTFQEVIPHGGLNLPNIPPQGYTSFAVLYKIANVSSSVLTPRYGENMRLQDEEGNLYKASIEGGENAYASYQGRMEVFPTELYPGYELYTVVVFVVPGHLLYNRSWRLLLCDSAGKNMYRIPLVHTQ